MINYDNKHNRRIFFIALIMLVILLAGYFSFWRLIVSVQTQADSVRMKRLLVTNREEFESRLRRAMADTTLDRERLNKHFVHASDIVTFINGLEKMGNDLGLTTHITSLAENWHDSNNGVLSLSIKFSGKFTDVYRYLTLVEQLPEQIVPIAITLDSSEDAGAPSTKRAAAGAGAITWTAEVKADVNNYVKN